MLKNFLFNRWRGDSLGSRVYRGSFFTLVGFGGARALRFLSNVILTRLLFPEAFGMMVLVQTVISALEMFSDTGVNASIIQNKRGNDPVFLNTAWSFQIGRGVLLWGLACLGAGPVATFYDEPMLAQLLPVAAFTTVIAGFASTKAATANKKLMLGRITAFELGSQVAALIVTILLALWWQSVWALVFGALLGRLMNVILSHVALPGAPNRLGWDWGVFRELFDFGKFIFISSIAGFFINSGDRAILGKFVSLTDLAVYNIGWLLAAVPMMLSRAFGRKILFPLYAKAPPAESAANRLKIAKVRFALTGSMMAVSFLLALTGDWLVRTLYLPEYHLAGPILVLVAVACLPSIILAAYGGLLLGVGNSRDYTILLITIALTQTTLLYFGVSAYGLIGAIGALCAAQLLVYPLTVYMARRHKGWYPLHDGIYLVLAAVIAAIVMWLHPDAVTQVLSGAP
jgi:O-antigen/teichoic acid export membrane protein